jgi:bifunctional UDP-N-acetylglucosamine pyrophosphorylase/glucosamine-1-phosphate N-acetyltransferase
VQVVEQPEARGTGDAARIGIAAAADADWALILYGDTPLLRSEDLRALLDEIETSRTELAFLTCRLDDPYGYGRVLRGANGRPQEVREERDLRDDRERGIAEVNAGVYCARLAPLRDWLLDLQPANAQGEYYLTDVVARAAQAGGAAAVVGSSDALLGVNDRHQLVEVEARLHARIAERHGRNGVTVHRGARIDESVTIEADAEIEAGVTLRGRTHVAAGARIDVGAVVENATIGKNAVIRPYSVVAESEVGEAAVVGPFAHLRPGSVICNEAHVGNFVETKKTRLGPGSKANHLSYLGDGEIGSGVNIGAGTIFCNYDGFSKHTTLIEEGAFIGSDSQLVAPVRIGKGAYVATGTTVTRDVPDDALAVGRTRQENKDGYASVLRKRLGSRAQRRSGG